MFNDGSITDDNRVISESFNNFFINIGPILAKSISITKSAQ